MTETPTTAVETLGPEIKDLILGSFRDADGNLTDESEGDVIISALHGVASAAMDAGAFEEGEAIDRLIRKLERGGF